MAVSHSNDQTAKQGGKLRNFDLTVEEIRVIKAIETMNKSLEDAERRKIDPARIRYFRAELEKLKEKLDEIRENTLIR